MLRLPVSAVVAILITDTLQVVCHVLLLLPTVVHALTFLTVLWVLITIKQYLTQQHGKLTF